MNLEKIKQAFDALGFSVLSVGKKNANGPDMWILKNGLPKSVEIKVASRTPSGSLQVHPVEPNRMQDDLIAIQINDYILIEPMRDHLKLCAPKGYRTLTEII